MSMNVTPYGAKQPMFVKQAPETDSANGVKQCWANINDVTNLCQLGPDKWIAYSRCGVDDKLGSKNSEAPFVYCFDDKGARQIINYLA